jgi:hypothetical protein
MATPSKDPASAGEASGNADEIEASFKLIAVRLSQAIFYRARFFFLFHCSRFPYFCEFELAALRVDPIISILHSLGPN